MATERGRVESAGTTSRGMKDAGTRLHVHIYGGRLAAKYHDSLTCLITGTRVQMFATVSGKRLKC